LNALFKKLKLNIAQPFWLFLAALIIFISFVVDVPLNGDTYRYANAIQTFNGPVVHLGYFLLGSVWYKILSIFGFDPVMSLNLMSAFFGALSVALVYMITNKLGCDKVQSMISSLTLCVSGSVLLYSIHGEVYIPQLSFVLLSIYFILNKSPLFSTLSIIIATSITPTSLLAIPGILYIIYMRKYPSKVLLYFISPLILIAGIVLISKFSAVIHVFLTAIHSPTVFSKNSQLFNLLYKYSKNYLLFISRHFTFLFCLL